MDDNTPRNANSHESGNQPESIVGRYINRPGNAGDRSGNTGGGNGPASDGTAGNETDPNAPIEIGGLVALPGSMAVMLDLRFKDGTRSAIPYGYITDLDFDPQAGILLSTAAKSVAITGRGLLPVYTAITTQTALAVCESTTGFDEGGGDPFVESITVSVVGAADGEAQPTE